MNVPVLTHGNTMTKNKRRIETTQSNPGISTNFIDINFDDGTAINIHGYRAECAIEPEIGDSNATGFWAVWVLPGGVIQNSDLPATLGALGDEKHAPYLWGAGVWAASNQTPWNMPAFAPKTSRNMQRGGRIVFEIVVTGITSGNVSLDTFQTCFTTDV